MAKQHINKRTNNLFCPINNFKDCVKARCFFWTAAADATALYESLFVNRLSRPLRDTCKLLVLNQLAELILLDVGTTRSAALGAADVLGAILDRSHKTEEPVLQASPPADLALHRQLREISEKLDALLKKS